MIPDTFRRRRRFLVPEVVQTSAMDCGPASLKCLLEGFGISASYGRLREACQTDVDGTSIDTMEISIHKDELEYGVGESNEANSQILATQISLRDQAIGELTLEGTGTWTAEQKNLIDAVAAQTAIALENARLVSESRQIAIRERMLAEINSKIWSSNTIDAVLQTAIKELGRRLDASSATIELNLDDHS